LASVVLVLVLGCVGLLRLGEEERVGVGGLLEAAVLEDTGTGDGVDTGAGAADVLRTGVLLTGLAEKGRRGAGEAGRLPAGEGIRRTEVAVGGAGVGRTVTAKNKPNIDFSYSKSSCRSHRREKLT
jgi:hypothetical protein